MALMKRKGIIAIAISALMLAGCGSVEDDPAPYGQAYIDQRPDGWTQEDGDRAVDMCHDKLAEELTPEPGLITSDRAFTDQVFGSPTNLVVGGSATVHGKDSLLDQRKVTFLCEVNDPLGDNPLVTVHALP